MRGKCAKCTNEQLLNYFQRLQREKLESESGDDVNLLRRYLPQQIIAIKSKRAGRDIDKNELMTSSEEEKSDEDDEDFVPQTPTSSKLKSKQSKAGSSSKETFSSPAKKPKLAISEPVNSEMESSEEDLTLISEKKVLHEHYVGEINFFPTEHFNGAFKDGLSSDQLSICQKQLSIRRTEIERDLVKFFGDKDRVSSVFH